MANPKRQHSKQRTRKRATHKKLDEVNVSNSELGSKAGYAHRICPVTGSYKGKQVVPVKKSK